MKDIAPVSKLKHDVLLTLAPADCGNCGEAAVVFGAFELCSNTNALHLVSRNAMSSVVSGISWGAVVCISHSLCVSASSVDNNKLLNCCNTSCHVKRELSSVICKLSKP
jgi:hypothetical protein